MFLAGYFSRCESEPISTGLRRYLSGVSNLERSDLFGSGYAGLGMIDNNSKWDEQIDNDSVSGKLDFTFEEARQEAATGLLREWPIPTAETPTAI